MWKAIISRFLCLFHHFWKEAVLTGCFIFHLLSSNVFNFLIRNSLKGKRRNFLFFSRYELKVCPLSLSISLPGITGKLSVMKLERQRMCFFFRSSWKKSNSNHKNDKFFFSFSLHAQLSLLFIFFFCSLSLSSIKVERTIQYNGKRASLTSIKVFFPLYIFRRRKANTTNYTCIFTQNASMIMYNGSAWYSASSVCFIAQTCIHNDQFCLQVVSIVYESKRKSFDCSSLSLSRRCRAGRQ